MKLCATATLVAALAAPAVQGQQDEVYARCHIYWAPNHPPMSCGGGVDDPQVRRWTCGDTVKNACISTEDYLSSGDPRCTDPECYEITYFQPEFVPIEPQVCKDGVCPAYMRRTYIKAVDYSESTEVSNAIHEMSQIGWERLCPYLCVGEDVCVEDPETCGFGAYADSSYPNGDNTVYPGACFLDRLLVTRRKIPCDGDDADGSPVPGNVGDPFPPHDGTTTTSTTDPNSSSDSTTTTTDPNSSSDSTTTTTDPNSSSDSTTTTTDPNSSSDSTTTTTDPNSSSDSTTTTTDPNSSSGGGSTTTVETGTAEQTSSGSHVLPSVVASMIGVSAALWLM